jgi:putative membrane protein
MRQTLTSVAALLGAAAALSAAVPVQAGDAAGFLMDAIRTDLAEIKFGELAEHGGQSEDVRQFGRMLVTDHSKSLKKATELAKALDVAVPAEPSDQAEKRYDALAKLAGAEFDSVFVSQMIRGHQEAVAKFSEQAESADSPKIADLAKEALPMLREHLEHAQSLVKGSGG